MTRSPCNAARLAMHCRPAPLALLALALNGCASGSAPSAMPDDLRDFALRYSDAWSSQEPARVASFYAEDGVLAINGGAPSVGREAITEAARGFMVAFPDMVVALDSLHQTDAGVAYHWTLTGTNTGPGGTGRAVRISGFETWTRWADGRIAESIGRFDADDYRRQLAGASDTP